MKEGKPLKMEREGQGIQRMSETTLKSSVAAHQAECGCHPAHLGCCGRPITDLAARDPEVNIIADARDSSGQPWHVDPLCKVRPEARS